MRLVEDDAVATHHCGLPLVPFDLSDEVGHGPFKDPEVGSSLRPDVHDVTDALNASHDVIAAVHEGRAGGL